MTLRVTALSSCLLLGACLSWHTGPIAGEPAGATFAELEGARVRYVDEGEGPAVVLVHGFASSLDAWATVRPALRERHRVIALDLKGFGWSDRPEGDYAPEAQARLVFALMDRLGVERADVVAHSWGASVALAMALAAPERVRRLALYSAYAYEGQRNTFFEWADASGMGELLFAAFYDQRPDERIALAFYDDDNLDQAMVDRVEAQLARPGTRAAALAAVRQMGLEARQRRYSEIEAPTLLLWGREDRVSTLPWGERLSNELPRAELEVYPRCGHFPMIEARHRSTEDLLRFLARTDPAPAHPAPAHPAPAHSAPAPAPAHPAPAPTPAHPAPAPAPAPAHPAPAPAPAPAHPAPAPAHPAPARSSVGATR